MDSRIQYLNTNLDLTSAESLAPLVEALERRGLYSLSPPHRYVGKFHRDSGKWFVILETNRYHKEPEATIGGMLKAIEALPPEQKEAWSRCTRREFNIGYDCGAEPWAFNQGLSTKLLARIAQVGASLRITIYPERAEDRTPVLPSVSAEAGERKGGRQTNSASRTPKRKRKPTRKEK